MTCGQFFLLLLLFVVLCFVGVCLFWPFPSGWPRKATGPGASGRCAPPRPARESLAQRYRGTGWVLEHTKVALALEPHYLYVCIELGRKYLFCMCFTYRERERYVCMCSSCSEAGKCMLHAFVWQECELLNNNLSTPRGIVHIHMGLVQIGGKRSRRSRNYPQNPWFRN